MATITLANRKGVLNLGGVIFTDGVAEGVALSPNRRKFFEQPVWGATINDELPASDPLEARTVRELRELAAGRNIDLAKDARKADIIAAITAQEFDNIVDQDAVQDPDVTVVDLPAGADADSVLAAILES